MVAASAGLIFYFVAGLPLEKVFGSKTSVYTGSFTNDWQNLSLKDAEQCSSHAGLGIEASMNANRISWFFNFKGTSFNVDSACSSSLVALDLACANLISRDTDMVRRWFLVEFLAFRLSSTEHCRRLQFDFLSGSYACFVKYEHVISR